MFLILFFIFTSLFGSLTETRAGQNEDNYRMGQPAVVVNGMPLSDTQIQTLTQLYATPPLPGNYWYDSISGLYGYMGQGAVGVLQPGLNFGPLSRQASGGTTGVLINGRELNVQEYMGLNQLAGGQVAQGSYWLASNGNIGVEGYPQPLGNLYSALQAAQAYQANAQGNSGGSGWWGSPGDNFWSSSRTGTVGNESGGTGYIAGEGFSVIYDK